MIRCQTCGTQNLDGSQYCDECGDSQQKYKAPQVIEALNDESENPESTDVEIPVFQSANVTSIEIPMLDEDIEVQDGSNQNVGGENFADELSADESLDEMELIELKTSARNSVDDILPSPPAKTNHARLIIERGQAIGTEFSLSSDESYIGRWDADNGIFPDVDLDAHDAEAKVSRKHARILHKNGQYMLEDLGSTNGTFINRGRRLIPGNPHPLRNNDEIIVGKTFLRFHLN